MNNKLIAIRRTVVNAVVGLVLAWLANLGIDIDGDALTLVLDGLVIGLWYVLSNWLLTVSPEWLTKVLALFTGGAVTPTYTGTNEA